MQREMTKTSSVPERVPPRKAVAVHGGSGPAPAAEGVLFSLAQVVEQRDGVTAGHCERLAFTGVALGTAMKLDQHSLLTLYLGGYLHDIGKVGLPDSILFKPGKLNEQEWEVMRTHPARGEAICKPLGSFSDVLPLIRGHHERMDGTGYPDGLAGERFPLLARVLQIVDIYDALTTPRPYKEPFTRRQALETLEEEADRGWRDREATRLFVQLNERVLEKIGEYSRPASDTTMRDSLRNLQSFLAS